MAEKASRPRKRPSRASASAAIVPSTVAAAADAAAMPKEAAAASSMARSSISAAYQRSDQPPHTVTSREALNEKITRMTIGRYRKASPSASEVMLKTDS